MKVKAKKVVVVKKKTKENIYKQLEVLSPEEIKFLSTVITDTVDYAIRIIQEQELTIDSLEYMKKHCTDGDAINAFDKNIQSHCETVEANKIKMELMKSINNKLKSFEGIV